MVKRNIVFVVMALSAALALSAATASAAVRELMVVKVPFAFRAGMVTLPAGEYLLKQDGGDRNLLIESRDGRHSAWVYTGDEPATRQAPTQTELIFSRYGTEHFLSEVWVVGETLGGGGHEGFTLGPSSLETKTASAHKGTPERVHVPATRRG